MTDAEFQQAKAANDEAARMQKETWGRYKAYQSKLALAVEEYYKTIAQKETKKTDNKKSADADSGNKSDTQDNSENKSDDSKNKDNKTDTSNIYDTTKMS